MKHLYFLLFFSIALLQAQTYEVQNIKYSGDPTKRINFVILSEGYQTAEFPQFVTDATSLMNDMFTQTPFAQYENYFNVYLIKVPSMESGASHPSTASDEASSPFVPVLSVNNYFGTTFDSFSIHRLLYSVNTSTIATVLANNFPQYDQALILVNSPYYGGSGGLFPFSSTESSASEIAIHELGHSFANLKDEYYPGDGLAAEAINMTQNNNPSTIKWKNWYGDNGIGAYAYGTSGTPATWYRPHQFCKMRYLGYPFCSVCTEGIIEKIHSLVSPIDSYSPVSSTVDNPTFPATFQLDLIETIPNTLQTTWTLNASNFASNVASVNIQDTDLTDGSNTLSAVITDGTSLLRVDNHETIHVYTVTWTIDYSLGIDEISSSSNQININFYPNPVEDIMTIKTENALNLNLTARLLSLDGKLIKTFNLVNEVSQEISIAEVSQGLYLLNFYEGTTQIASKKVVKN